jgi:hypothetical protein
MERQIEPGDEHAKGAWNSMFSVTAARLRKHTQTHFENPESRVNPVTPRAA